ncbi:putative 5-epiaristolochene 1,3-dihydroxylase [Rosa chinensis]|uniref:Putative 5-epiaristolochene 1,3-dihydroxylase n=1 Tax=Rosa chinensis TaxID=74649 RepID=A0A2P6SET6_ROSCH|nr:putative 5-epiaristolochene 1,3-dihydroxylase [Rosa chinensis]
MSCWASWGLKNLRTKSDAQTSRPSYWTCSLPQWTHRQQQLGEVGVLGHGGVKETLRLHPVAPLLLPYQSTEDYTVNRFHISKKSRIMINVWSIGRDPNAWTEAEKFIPEKFVDSSIDLRENHFELLPFGSGQRRCPGIQLGLTVVQLVVA